MSHAQDPMPTLCSCSPTVFTFVLSLDQSCDDNDIESNVGIDGSFCFTEEGVAVPQAPEPVEDVEVDPKVEPNAMSMPGDGPVRRRRRAAHVAPTPKELALMPFNTRNLQGDDPVTEIVSVQFLEFDTSGDLTVINQDDTYADVALANGDRIKFYSASSFLDTELALADQMSNPALVPGGASLILYGKTESGVIVRNRFFWMYDMNCGRENEPVKVDDEIGWVTVAEVSNAWPAFCPALPEGSPTIAPRTVEPTLTPSKSPTLKPSTSPVMSMATTGKPSGGGVHPPAFSKSQKGPKTHKPSKSGKSSGDSDSKSGKSDSKSGKHSKSSGSSDDGHNMDGKTGKEDDWQGAYKMGRVTAFDAERSGSASLYSFGSVIMSVVACVMMLSRQ